MEHVNLNHYVLPLLVNANKTTMLQLLVANVFTNLLSNQAAPSASLDMTSTLFVHNVFSVVMILPIALHVMRTSTKAQTAQLACTIVILILDAHAAVKVNTQVQTENVYRQRLLAIWVSLLV